MSVEPNPAIASAATQVAHARAAHARAKLPLQDATARRDKIAERVEALDRRRAEIVSRRQAGDIQPEDGPELALIAADTEGAKALLIDAEAAIVTLTPSVEATHRAIGFAAEGLRAAEDAVAEAALVAHAKKLDALLLETVTRIAALHRRRGGVPPYGPSRELALALRKVQAARNEL